MTTVVCVVLMTAISPRRERPGAGKVGAELWRRDADHHRRDSDLIAFYYRWPGTRKLSSISLSVPEFNSHNLNVCSKLAVGALSGFEYIAILAGECRAPAKNISRSVWISAPIIALMFILGTGSVLAFVTPDKVDLIAPIPQVLSIGFGSFGWVSTVISITIFGVAARQIALMSIYFAGNTRLPMVAGWDNLLPEWFAKLHKKYRTPVNSILFVGATTLVFSLAPLIGVKEAEAFQFQDNAASIFYALIYSGLVCHPASRDEALRCAGALVVENCRRVGVRGFGHRRVLHRIPNHRGAEPILIRREDNCRGNNR